MHDSPLLDTFEPALVAVQRLIEHFSDQGIVIGGVAASLLGKPRLTADVDAMLLVSPEQLPELLQIAAHEGLLARIQDAESFARRNRVLLLVDTASQTNVDISLGVLPFEVEAVERSVVQEIRSLRLRLPTPEDLIILKAVAHRAKDLSDIEEVINRQPALDWARIESWVKQFAEVLESPELWTDIQRLRR